MTNLHNKAIKHRPLGAGLAKYARRLWQRYIALSF